MKSNLVLKRVAVLFSIYIAAALILLISAGSFKFWKGWLFLGLSFFPVFITIIFLSFQKTRILEINIDFAGLIKNNLKKIIIFSLIFIAGLVASGVNFRLKITQLPTWIVIQFSVIYLFALIFFINTCREYKLLSRHLFERRRKKLLDQGPYSVVRHPMYSSLILIFISVPLILGSFTAFAIYMFFPVYMIVKMYLEEKSLPEEIKDYSDYKDRVKYKLIPFIW